MVVKKKLKKIIHKAGIEVFTLSKLPLGINHLRDSARHGDLKNPGIIFDVGANIGQTSVQLRDAFKQSEIYAFEPVGSTFCELVKNVSAKNIKSFNIGFGDKKAKNKIYIQSSSGLNSLVNVLNKPNETRHSEDVEISTIDSFCKENNISSISLLKIDTEGYGLRVLDGAKDMLGNGNIKWIFIEVGFNEQDKRHDNYHAVHKILTSYSFELFGLYNQWIEHSRLEYCNALFSLKKLK